MLHPVIVMQTTQVPLHTHVSLLLSEISNAPVKNYSVFLEVTTLCLEGESASLEVSLLLDLTESLRLELLLGQGLTDGLCLLGAEVSGDPLLATGVLLESSTTLLGDDSVDTSDGLANNADLGKLGSSSTSSLGNTE